ncbi:MAG: hypothetical protein NZM09_11760 [Ignavibacterium sp.]|nr:hypothetical protein [Ignavibacterium sp.]MCX7610998.1 hypothetical protein [Ignavibacterium sp.]MDW8376350.1 hypothetical protein [Ignavibacteriales bacterium]
MKIFDIESLIDKFKNKPKVFIKELPVGTIIYLETENSTYKLEVIDPNECCVLASGGYFQRKNIEPAKTYIIGSTFGGSMIFKDQLIEGLFCEFYNNIITSRIKRIFIYSKN